MNYKISDLELRLTQNSLVQEGEAPNENPEELLKTLDQCVTLNFIFYMIMFFLIILIYRNQIPLPLIIGMLVLRYIYFFDKHINFTFLLRELCYNIIK